MDVAIFVDIAPCSRYVNRRFGGIYELHFHGRKSAARDTGVWQTTSHKQTTRRYIPDDGNIRSCCCQNLKSSSQ
jgi:hypothetical protein